MSSILFLFLAGDCDMIVCPVDDLEPIEFSVNVDYIDIKIGFYPQFLTFVKYGFLRHKLHFS